MLHQGCSTSVGGHHSCRMQVSLVLQQCKEDALLQVVIDTKNITVHTIRLSLKESCLKINVKDLPTFAGCQFATHPKSRTCGSRRICLLMLLLFVLETSQYQSGLCLEEVALSVCLDGEHPSSCHIISRFNLPHVDEITKTSLSTQDLYSRCFGSANCLQYPRTYWADASFRARDLILAVVPAALPQVARQRSNMSLVRPSTPFGTSIIMLPKSLVTSFRYYDRCTHDTVINLHMSCWSPFSVATKLAAGPWWKGSTGTVGWEVEEVPRLVLSFFIVFIWINGLVLFGLW